MNRWGITAVAVALGVALAGPSWGRGEDQPSPGTREYKGRGVSPDTTTTTPKTQREMQKGIRVPGASPTIRVLEANLSCTAWFAKDSAGTKYPVPTIFEAWKGGSVWVFYAVTNPAKQIVNNVQVDAKVSSAGYYPDSYPYMWPENKLYLQKYVKNLSSAKWPAKNLSVPPGQTNFFLDQHTFWPVWEAWKPGSGLNHAYLKWVVEVHLVASDKKCSTSGITLQYRNLP